MQTEKDAQRQLNEGLDKKEEKEWSEAAAVRGLPRIINQSPFCQVLAELEAEKDPWFTSKKIRHAVSPRDAFFINIDERPSHSLSREGIYNERHFSIDTVYKTSESAQHGLTTLHYTETYFSKKSQAKMTFHAYLNNQRQYLYGEKRQGSNPPLKLEKEEQELLKINISTSIGLLDYVFEEREKRYLETKAKADELEINMSKLSNRIRNKETLDAYIGQAKEFVSAIKVLNQYCENEDLRGRYVSTMLSALEKRAAEIQQAESALAQSLQAAHVTSASVEKTASKEAPQNLQKKIPITNSLENIYNAIIESLESLEKQLSQKLPRPVNSAGIIEEEFLKAIQEKSMLSQRAMSELMALYKFPDSFLDSNKKGMLNKLFPKMYHLIAQYDRPGIELLQEKILEGDLEAVRALFPLLGNKLQGEFYCTLLNRMVSEKSKTEALMVVSRFLNDHSDAYRQMVTKVSRTEKYPLPHQEMEKLFKESFEKIPELQPLTKSRKITSLLGRAYCNDNLALFEMLLQHGADSNSWGFSKEGSTGFSTIFNFISLLPSPNYLAYFRLLLSYGANPNLLITKGASKEIKHTMNRVALVGRKELSRNSEKNAVSVQVETNSLLTPHPLWALIKRRDVTGIELVLPYTSVEMIARHFSQLAHDKGIMIGREPGCEVGIVFRQNKEERSEIDKNKQPGEFFGHIFYPDGSSLGSEKFKLMQLIYQVLSNKLASVTEEEFELAYKALYKNGMDMLEISYFTGVGDVNAVLASSAHSAKDLAYYAISGALHLLMARCSLLASEEQRIKFLYAYYPDLYKKGLVRVLPIWYKGNNLEVQNEWCRYYMEVVKYYMEIVNLNHQKELAREEAMAVKQDELYKYYMLVVDRNYEKELAEESMLAKQFQNIAFRAQMLSSPMSRIMSPVAVYSMSLESAIVPSPSLDLQKEQERASKVSVSALVSEHTMASCYEDNFAKLHTELELETPVFSDSRALLFSVRRPKGSRSSFLQLETEASFPQQGTSDEPKKSVKREAKGPCT